MEQYISAEKVENYLILPKNFDWELVDQEVGFQKVFEFFPESTFSDLEESHEEIHKLLMKAGIYYAFIFSIPKIKVQISNFGIQQFEQSKTKVAPWWDVRDLGLSMLKVADRCLADALTAAGKIEELKNELPFFSKSSPHIGTPSEFEEIFSINYSPDLFSKLKKLIRKAYLVNIQNQISKACLELVEEDETLTDFIKEALAFYALYYASLLPGFLFTKNSVVMQYEELPWQKSVILDAHAKTLAGQNFLYLAESSLKMITDHIAAHPDDFPCVEPPKAHHKIQAKDSGIYLL